MAHTLVHLLTVAVETVVRISGQVRLRLALSWRGLALLTAALVTIAGLVVVLSAVSEDVVASNGLERTDLTEVQAVASQRNAVVVGAALALTRLGSVPVLLLLGAAAAAFLWWRGERLFVTLTPLLALFATGAVTGLAKQLIDRQRPPALLHLVTETGASFPSGHSGDSAALFITAAIVIPVTCAHTTRTRTLIVVAALAAATAIGASRVILGVHYPTDVLAGWLLGAICAITVATTMLLLRHRVTRIPPTTPSNRVARTIEATAMRSRDPAKTDSRGSDRRTTPSGGAALQFGP